MSDNSPRLISGSSRVTRTNDMEFFLRETARAWSTHIGRSALWTRHHRTVERLVNSLANHQHGKGKSKYPVTSIPFHFPITSSRDRWQKQLQHYRKYIIFCNCTESMNKLIIYSWLITRNLTHSSIMVSWIGVRTFWIWQSLWPLGPSRLTWSLGWFK